MFTATVTDNWYAIYIRESGKLLAVGTWLPPETDGIEVGRVTPEVAAALLRQLAERAK